MSLLMRKDKPYKTVGKVIWWIPDTFLMERGWNRAEAMPEILYRDPVRQGVWVPQENLATGQIAALELAASEEE